MNIIVGKSYDYFDDGKIRMSRHSIVIITEIIPFDQIDEETLSQWREELNDLDELYAKETDFFVKGILKESDIDEVEVVFVRTVDDGWFSLGLNAGCLDFDGTLAETLI